MNFVLGQILSEDKLNGQKAFLGTTLPSSMLVEETFHVGP
jgi:hypothetical protein